MRSTHTAVVAVVVCSLLAGVPAPVAGASVDDRPTATVSVESERVDVGSYTRVNVTVRAPGRTDGIQELVVRIDNGGLATIKDVTAPVAGTADAETFGNHATLTWSAENVSLEEGPVVLSMLVRGIDPGTTAVAIDTAEGIERSDGGFYDVRRLSGALSVDPARNDGSGPGGTVGLDVPSVSLAVNGTATLPVGVTGASGGLSAAQLDVALPDTVRVEEVTTPTPLSSVNVSNTASGPLVGISGVGYDAPGPNVTVASVRLRGVAPGEKLGIVVLSAAADRDATPYELPGGRTVSISVTGSNGSVPAPSEPPALGRSGSAGDPDGDGRFEDVDGDGVVNVIDVAVLLDEFESDAAQSNRAAFDFSGDGRLDVIDVADLLDEVGT